jgi:proton-dependent oligopeptide transporter, POT family
MSSSETVTKERQFLGHPAGLFILFFAEMWERFCYYGMRGLLTVFLIDVFLKGDTEAFAIYGTYTALVYMAPVLGGKIADKFLGYKRAVIIGGILMAIGEFMLLGQTNFWLYLGMAGIIVGNGYFKANISSIVGKLYRDGDERRDSGFTIFYIGINVGALLATTVCVEVGRKVGYEYGFALAGIGMILGTLIFVFGKKLYEHAAAPPNPEKLKSKVLGPLSQQSVIILCSLAIIPAIFMLIQFNEIMPYLLAVVGVYVIYNLLSAAYKEDKSGEQAVEGKKVWLHRMLAMIIIFVFNIAFWACFEQAGTSLTLFARRNVDRLIGGWEMSDATTQFFNPLYIILFGSIFSIMWIKLQQRKINPSIAMKFGLGIIQLGLGYLVVLLGGMFLSEAYLVPLWTLAILYLLHTTGELFLSPIGLSMVTKLAPKKITGTAMGGWFLSFAFANYAAAVIAMATGSGGHGGGGGTDTEPTRAEYLTKIDSSANLVEANCLALVSTAEKFNNATGFVGEDTTVASLPKELHSVVKDIYPTFMAIHSEVGPLLNDTIPVDTTNKWVTSSYNGKEILWAQLTANYAVALKGLAGSLKKLTEATYKMNQGSLYKDVEGAFSSGIVGIGDGLNAMHGNVISIIDRKNKGDDQFNSDKDSYLFKGSNTAMEKFDKNYSTIASHMYWDIYSNVYMMMGLITICIGLLLCFISKPLTKLMHGIE